MFFTILELVYLIVMVLAIGYIFSGFIQKPVKDPIERVLGQSIRFNWQNIKYAILVAAPGIVLHELAHKFTAMSFGLEAQFFIWPTGLIIGVALKVIGSGFILLAPGYVSTLGATGSQLALIAFAGPFINLVLWLGTKAFLKFKQGLSRNVAIFLGLTSKINMWLFLFNMIPFGPLDGAKVFGYLFGLM